MDDPVKTLAKRIAESFPTTGIPPRDRIVTASAPLSIESALADKRWDAVPEETIMELGGEFAFLQPEAFAYYLPAILLYLLPDPNRGDVMIDHLLGQLTPPTLLAIEQAAATLEAMDRDAAEMGEQLRDPAMQAMWRDGFETRMRLLSDAQVATIGAVVDHWKRVWQASVDPVALERILDWVKTRLPGWEAGSHRLE